MWLNLEYDASFWSNPPSKKAAGLKTIQQGNELKEYENCDKKVWKI